MNAIVEYLTGMNKLTDQVIAMDFLISAKNGVRSYAMALTEACTPEVSMMLERQLEDAIDTHEQISAYLIDRGWYHPWHAGEQIRFDLQNVQTAMDIPSF